MLDGPIKPHSTGDPPGITTSKNQPKYRYILHKLVTTILRHEFLCAILLLISSPAFAGILGLGSRVERELFKPLVPSARSFKTCLKVDPRSGTLIMSICTEDGQSAHDYLAKPVAPPAEKSANPARIPASGAKSEPPVSAPPLPARAPANGARPAAQQPPAKPAPQISARPTAGSRLPAAKTPSAAPSRVPAQALAPAQKSAPSPKPSAKPPTVRASTPRKS